MGLKRFEQFKFDNKNYNDVEEITFNEFNENISYDSIVISDQLKKDILHSVVKYDKYFDVMDKHYHGMDDDDNSLLYMNPDSTGNFFYTEIQIWMNHDSELFICFQIREAIEDKFYRIDIGFGTEEVFKLIDDVLSNTPYYSKAAFTKFRRGR